MSSETHQKQPQKWPQAGKIALVSTAVIVVAIVAFIMIGSGREDEGRSGGYRGGGVVGVEAATAQRRDMRDMRVFTGTLRAERQYDAAAKVGGQILQMAVNLGDCVDKGALIARLENEEYQQQVAQAQAELAVSKASLAEAQSALVAANRDYERVRDLRERRVASAAELDSVDTARQAQQARLALAEAQIQQREASLRAAEIRLSYTSIYADWENGDDARCRHVAARHVDQGAMIAANAPVVTLVDLSELLAVINVSERDYARIQAGQRADVTIDPLAGQAFSGTVARKAPVFGEASRQARVEIAVPNPEDTLKAGMFARVHIELGRDEQALAVPVPALIQRGAERGAFVVEEGRARFVPLVSGITQEGWVQVDGLSAGDQVVTLGHHLLSDGMAVNVTAAE